MKLLETYASYYTAVAFLYTRGRYLKDTESSLRWSGGSPTNKYDWIFANGYKRIVKK